MTILEFLTTKLLFDPMFNLSMGAPGYGMPLRVCFGYVFI